MSDADADVDTDVDVETAAGATAGVDADILLVRRLCLLFFPRCLLFPLSPLQQ